MIQQIREQHPEETPEQHQIRLEYRQKHLNKRHWPIKKYGLLVLLSVLMFIAGKLAHCQTSNVDITRVGGTVVSGPNLPTDPQGPDAQGAAQTGKPLQNGGRYYTDGTVRTIATDTNGDQLMSIIGTVTLGNLPQQPFLNTTDFNDTLAAAVAAGSTIVGNSTPKWAALAGSTLSGGGGYYNETQATLSAPSAPVLTVSNTGGSFPQASLLTAYVVITVVNAFGETTSSTESSVLVSTAAGCLAASTTCSVIVTAPALTGNATGYTVYTGRSPGDWQQQTVSNNCVNIVANCTIQLYGTGVIPPTYNTASNGTLVAPTWVAATGTGAPVNATGATLAPKSLNLTLKAENFNGVDMCAKISSAWNALPSTGGVIDATGFQGSQACAGDPFLTAVNDGGKNIDLVLGAVTINPTLPWTGVSNIHVHGLGPQSVIAFAPSAGLTDVQKSDLWKFAAASNIEIDHVKLTGTANTGRLLTIDNTSSVNIHDITCSGAKYLPLVGPFGCVQLDTNAVDVTVQNSIFTNNGPGPAYAGATVNFDLGIWQDGSTSGGLRVKFLNNTITGSFTEESIGAFDCFDCLIQGNVIDQNNQITTTTTKGGYGIMSYQGIHRPRNMKIIGNHVTNAAGSCIYVASNDHAVVVGNDVQTCAQQESDASLPVAGIALNDCPNCLVDGNSIKTSTKDGITLVQPSTGTVISNNAIQTITQYGVHLRTATDASVIGNQIQSSTLDWLHETGSRNQIANNHILTSGAATFVASDLISNNCTDAVGCIGHGSVIQMQVVTADFVTAANTNLQLITGLSFTFPASIALNAKIDCDLMYSQQTAAVADAFGIQDVTVAPTNLSATGFVQTAVTTWVDSVLTNLNTTTATNIVAMTPSAITTVWHAQLHIGVEHPSNASASLLQIMAKTGTAADTLTVKRGSTCVASIP